MRGAPPPDKKLLEYQFVFACVWAFGGCMLVDKVSDYRTQFSKWWVSEWKNVQFPEKVRGRRCRGAALAIHRPGQLVHDRIVASAVCLLCQHLP